MNAITFRNSVLLFNALFASWWTYVFWTDTPKMFKLIFGKERSPLEASGYRYAACSIIGMVLMCLTAVWGQDFEKRRALRILAPVWVANFVVLLADKAIYNTFWWNLLAVSFAFGIVTSYIGGFILSPEKVSIHVHKHVVPDPAVVAEASKAHQA